MVTSLEILHVEQHMTVTFGVEEVLVKHRYKCSIAEESSLQNELTKF